MAKFMHAGVADLMLLAVATASRVSVCSAQPESIAALSVLTLAQAEVEPGVSGGYTLADGVVSGRRLIVGAKSGVPVVKSGEATHIVLDDGQDLLYGTVCDPQPVVYGGTVTIPAWDIEIRGPA